MKNETIEKHTSYIRRHNAGRPHGSTLRRQVGVAIVAILLASSVALAALDLTARLFITPDERAYGRLAGVELPPVRYVPNPETWLRTDRDLLKTTISGEQVTVGDLWGFWQFEPGLGYRQEPDARSANDWWQSNNIGARSRVPTLAAVAAGRTRVLVFGDSFAHGSRVRQEAVWTSVLEDLEPSIEAVNLGGDGYSMAQAYLRYKGVAPTLDHHAAVLAVVPTADLWRDINVVRDLGDFWDSPIPMPRAVLAESGLRLVSLPYADTDAFFADNHPQPSAELVGHLRRYDRFYLPLRYEKPPMIGDLILYKLAASAVVRRQQARIWRELWQPSSEAVQVTRSIVAAMNDEVTAGGQSFLALILPTEADVPRLRNDSAFAAKWHAAAQAICGEVDSCLDVGPVMASLDPGCIDTGADGTHYGPRLNRVLAHIALARLNGSTDLLPEDPGCAG